jgi:preprotein translocase SecE subunit
VAQRNRRRARDRRARPGQDKSGLATAGGSQTGSTPGRTPDADKEPVEDDGVGTRSAPDELASSDSAGPRDEEREDLEGAPEPLEHATPDVELADAQVMLGSAGFVRPRDEVSAEYDRIYEDEIPDGDAEEPPAGSDGDGAGGGGAGGLSGTAPGGGGGGGEPTHPAVAPPVEHPGTFTRLVSFLRGSWRELHRVQWPDRRQVMQATGVVLGFVIVAGVYLGVADYVSQKVVHFILTK